MKFKYNPWVSMVALVLLATILVLTCTGCVTETEANDPEELTETEATEPDRFSVTAENHGSLQINVITDTLTGKEYIVVKSGYAGVTKLEG